jgi:phenylalanyl-tRNA synthetase beta chain
MLFSLAWLREYVDLPEAPSEIAAVLTTVGMAVEGMESRGTDTVLDVDVTTNRTDAMNHLGLARELATRLGRQLRLPAAVCREGTAAAAAAVRIAIEPGSGGVRYAARVVRGVRIGPSPPWLVARLEAIGHRPINNVVDVTNFVLWETGQPLHAFDLDRIAPTPGETLPRIIARRARAGEKLTTLDQVERTLTPEMLVIADGVGPTALAGVMGGAHSEVEAGTTAVLLESAHFERARVRATARGVGLKTDASHRFERGADPEGCVAAADRAAALIVEVAGGEILAGAVDVRADWPAEWPPHGMLSRSRLNAFAGVEYSEAEVVATLSGLGFVLERTAAERWRVQVPSWRWYDIPARAGGAAVEEADLFEEVIRHGGFDRIPAALPALPGRDEGKNLANERRHRVRGVLAGAGYAEAIHFAFHGASADASFPALGGDGAPLALANPISEIYGVMRRSLVPNLLATARASQRRAEAVRLFEVGHVYPSERAELEALAVVVGGRVPGGATLAAGETTWGERQRGLELLDLKGVIEEVVDALGASVEFRAAVLPGLESDAGAEIWRAGQRIGLLGRAARSLLPFPLFVAEVLLEDLPAQRSVRAVDLPSRYPGVVADLTLTHAESTPWLAIDRVIRECAVPELAGFAYRGQYRGVGVPVGAINTTIRFHYQAEDRSLTQEEVNERHLALAADLAQRFAVKEPSAS